MHLCIDVCVNLGMGGGGMSGSLDVYIWCIILSHKLAVISSTSRLLIIILPSSKCSLHR